MMKTALYVKKMAFILYDIYVFAYNIYILYFIMFVVKSITLVTLNVRIIYFMPTTAQLTRDVDPMLV